MGNNIAVRTKTGNKVHLSTVGSSRTFCGARVAIRLTTIKPGAQPCGGCGLHPDLTAEQLAALIAK